MPPSEDSTQKLEKQITSLAESVAKLTQFVGEGQSKPDAASKTNKPAPTYAEFIQSITAPKQSVTTPNSTRVGGGSLVSNIASDLAQAALKDFIKAGGQLPAGVTPESFAAQYSSAFNIFGGNNTTNSFTGPTRPVDLNSALAELGLGGLNVGSAANPLGNMGDITSLFGGMGGIGALSREGGISGYIGTILGDTAGLVDAAFNVSASLGPQLNAALGATNTTPPLSQILGGVKGLSI